VCYVFYTYSHLVIIQIIQQQGENLMFEKIPLFIHMQYIFLHPWLTVHVLTLLK